MKYKRKPVLYDAYQTTSGTWTVINLLTKQKAILTDKEFKEQFEEAPQFAAQPKKKYEPKQYPALQVEIDPDTGQVKGFREITQGVTND
jgi:hypothetical protein